jgi:hypothetical protein
MKNTDAADSLKARVVNYYKKKHRVAFYELGLNKGGRLRADVFILAMSGHIVIVEVKSSVADWRADFKIGNYAAYCNQLYAAFYRPVYEKVKAEIPKGIGVFIFDETDGRRKPTILRAANNELDLDTRNNLLVRAAFRNADNCNRKNKGSV